MVLLGIHPISMSVPDLEAACCQHDKPGTLLRSIIITQYNSSLTVNRLKHCVYKLARHDCKFTIFSMFNYFSDRASIEPDV